MFAPHRDGWGGSIQACAEWGCWCRMKISGAGVLGQALLVQYQLRNCRNLPLTCRWLCESWRAAVN